MRMLRRVVAAAVVFAFALFCAASVVASLASIAYCVYHEPLRCGGALAAIVGGSAVVSTILTWAFEEL